MHIRDFSSAWVVLLVILLAACAPAAQPTATAPIGPYPAPQTDLGTPSPAYPLPVNNITPGSEIVYSVPEPGADTGVVIGVMLDNITKQPMGGATIYLGTFIYLTPAPSYSYAIQENSSPHTVSDELGRFAMGNVLPGSYIVMVWTPIGASVVVDPKTGSELSVAVEAGKVTDLGSIEGINPLKP